MLKQANPPRFAALDLPVPAPDAARWSRSARRSTADMPSAGSPQPRHRWAYADSRYRNAGAGDRRSRLRRSPNGGGATPLERFRAPLIPVAKNPARPVHASRRLIGVRGGGLRP